MGAPCYRKPGKRSFTMFRTYSLAEPPAQVDDLVDFRFMPEL